MGTSEKTIWGRGRGGSGFFKTFTIELLGDLIANISENVFVFQLLGDGGIWATEFI